ncbi:hypothetical protein GCM10010954_23510 [Halobacillus andaensis]|uniref:Putative Flp pilus-assembly TadG-like N-terminal domain-containing protein n=1 Tax=Halobacillus andaensis TaxID=1176239 RepID=A0A917EWY4_HALAA|nr:Tad domain-containing protein [Halobacillus andaensis]MBP2006058.1 hypothetical protein [Halobacillus andaensis]GGF23917.1 hypothetical protein GCM10010954_23510 [Halobacillus andaensis]
MRRRIRELFNREDGNALVFTALCLFVFCGFVALVVDGGSLFLEKSKLQKGVDASALAGVQEVLTSLSEAEAIAKEYGQKNGYTLAGAEVLTGDNFVEVEKVSEVPLTFAKVLGFDLTEVRAFSRAEISGTLKKREGIVPIGIKQEEFNPSDSFTMHFQPGNGENASVKGNFGFLDIDHPEHNTLRDKIKYGVTMEISDDIYESTETGFKWGHVKQSIDYRINADASEPHCQSYETADDSCERVIIVPIVETYSDVNGKSQVKIIGFAAFWIESLEKHEIKGRFIETITYGEFSEEGEESDYGVYGVRLVQ